MMRLILTTILLLCLSTVLYAEDLTHKSNIALMRDLYTKVNNTRTSVVNAQVNTNLIRERLECYAEYANYSERIQICNNDYLKGLVQAARNKIKSRPSLGRFVLNVGICPVMYNICMGQTGNDEERCVDFERQCIDYTLDTYWRGAAQDIPQTYRLK